MLNDFSIGGSQKYDGPAKLDFSFMSNGDDEGIPDELYEVIINPSSNPLVF
jgi:hypothetical protein